MKIVTRNHDPQGRPTIVEFTAEDPEEVLVIEKLREHAHVEMSRLPELAGEEKAGRA